MNTRKFMVELMGQDKNGNGGIKITRQPSCKLLKWYYHNRKTAAGLKKLEESIISDLGKCDVQAVPRRRKQEHEKNWD